MCGALVGSGTLQDGVGGMVGILQVGIGVGGKVGLLVGTSVGA
jgi:hypothetical protein